MTRRMLKSLSKKFGYKVMFEGKEFYTFPSASSLNKASIDELQTCGVGYRAKASKAYRLRQSRYRQLDSY